MSDDVDPIEVFFTELGLTRLSAAIAQQSLGDLVSEEDLSKYARVALLRSMHDDEHDGSAAMFHHYLQCLATVFSADVSTGYREVDGEPHIELDGETVPVTPEMLQHWEWLAMISGSSETAREFFDAVPETIRTEAHGVINAYYDSLIS